MPYFSRPDLSRTAVPAAPNLSTAAPWYTMFLVTHFDAITKTKRNKMQEKKRDCSPFSGRSVDHSLSSAGLYLCDGRKIVTSPKKKKKRRVDYFSHVCILSVKQAASASP